MRTSFLASYLKTRETEQQVSVSSEKFFPVLKAAQVNELRQLDLRIKSFDDTQLGRFVVALNNWLTEANFKYWSTNRLT
jgi:hypothetical protein